MSTRTGYGRYAAGRLRGAPAPECEREYGKPAMRVER